MRVFVAALLLSCATATVNTVPLADDTEFDAFLPPSTPPAGVEVPSLNTVPIATPPPAVVTPTAAPRRTAEPHDWTFEALAVIGVVAYIGYYVVGRRANAQVAQAFVDAYRPWLREQFSQAGIGADNPASSPLIKISDVSWEMWCSGRANCLGLLATLALRPRQDLAITALSALAPQPAAALASHVDVLTLELPIPASSPGPAFVFAVAEARRSKDFLEARKDITAVNPKVSTGRAAGLPDAYEVHSESHEITEAVLESGLRRLINDYPRVLRSLHITDQPALASSCCVAASSFEGAVRCLRVELVLPASRDAWDAELRPFVQATLGLVDGLAALRLSKGAAAKVAAARAELRAAVERDLQRERDEAARRARDEKKRQEEAAMSQLSREARRKAEEKQRKEAMAKAMPRMKFKSG